MQKPPISAKELRGSGKARKIPDVVRRQGMRVSYEPEAQRAAANSIITELRDAATFPPAAVELLERTLGEFERVHGPEHPKTVDLRRQLAAVLQGRGRVAEAVPLFERVLRGQERSLGSSAPETLEARYELALAHRDAGHHRQGLTVLADTVVEAERTLGSGHALAIASRQLRAELLGPGGG